MKMIFVTGGVISSLGKGIFSASLGHLLKSRGIRVFIQKLDPYINVDPGTMSPYQHGEVFVTEDGAETDLDIGHYERFLDESLSALDNVTTGQVYWSVISKERKGDYLGATVQVIPHITNEIKSRIFSAAREKSSEILIVEVGGTVGDIESLPYLETIRQIRQDLGPGNVMFIHLTLVPYFGSAGELKTKPTQHSVKELRSIGIHPDVIVCRTDHDFSNDLREKIALFCNVRSDSVLECRTCDSIYQVPEQLKGEGLLDLVRETLKLEYPQKESSSLHEYARKESSAKEIVRIAVVGKYVELQDSYMSVAEALHHAGVALGKKVKIDFVDSENHSEEVLKAVGGILVPGGFGSRGIEGKIGMIRFARENLIPFLGICLGMQCAVIEFARSVCGLGGANSREIDAECQHPVIDIMADQKKMDQKGGTMRLGAYPCTIDPDSILHRIYGSLVESERHRHRFEVNNAYRDQLQELGLRCSGKSPDGNLVEVVEFAEHPFFVGCQFHPEFKSRPHRPHPIFHAFVEASMKRGTHDS
ncbi:CTP synthase [bacterium]|jgi:CTP synthase|nr:CTP synthase [bacterium]